MYISLFVCDLGDESVVAREVVPQTVCVNSTSSLISETHSPTSSASSDGTVNLYSGQHVESFRLFGLAGNNGLGATVSLEYDGSVSKCQGLVVACEWSLPLSIDRRRFH